MANNRERSPINTNNVWSWNRRRDVNRSHSAGGEYRNFPIINDEAGPETMLSPNRFRFMSSMLRQPIAKEAKFVKSNSRIHHSSRLPDWLWSFIVATLGIRSNKTRSRFSIATVLHVLTLASGLCFAVSGMFFNVYDTMSSFTRTTLLDSVAKCVIGTYWIALGIYSHSLAARLFSNNRLVDCIRLHSKTFMKINMVFIIAVLVTTVLILDIYSNSQVILEDPENINGTKVDTGTCTSIGLKFSLCQVYFASKVFYSFLCLCWNLMVAAICLSVCRTLTIGIRQFMRELNFDSQIFDEYEMLLVRKACRNKSEVKREEFTGSWCIWDDDIKTFEEEDEGMPLASSREYLLKNIRTLRQNSISPDTLLLEPSINSVGNLIASDTTDAEQLLEYAERQPIHFQEVPCDYGSVLSAGDRGDEQERAEDRLQDDNVQNDDGGSKVGGEYEQSEGGAAPIMSNKELMLTYFKLMRRLASTSSLLQRWMFSWVSFVVVWCAMLIIYWNSHSASLMGFADFLLPVVAISLMILAYAEVNLEGQRLLKCVLPTEDRMPVIYYFQNNRLELKVYSLTVSYNFLVTAMAGVALTLASRIIITQFT